MSVVELERVGNIGLIALNNPPVNAASTALNEPGYHAQDQN